MHRFVSREVRALGLISATVGFMILVSPQAATAQIVIGGGGVGDAIGKSLQASLQKSIEALTNRVVAVSPVINVIADSTKTITLEFQHKNDEKVVAKISISNTPPSMRSTNRDAADSGKKKPSLLDQEENSKDTTSTSYKPMSGWIKGLPDTIAVAPGEKKKVTLTVTIPASVSAGEYAAWIVTEVAPDEKSQGFRTPVFASTKLIYKK